MASVLARPVEPQYTFDEVCTLLRCSRATLYRRMNERAFVPRPWNDHGKWKFSASAVNGYIEKRRAA